MTENLPKEQQMTTATPADPHTTESTCENCGGEIYRTLLESSGATRTYWRHEANGYNGCPKATENATHHGPWCDDEPETGCDTCRLSDGDRYAASILASLDPFHPLATQTVICNTTPPVVRGRVADRLITLHVVGSLDGCLYGYDDDRSLIGVAEWAVLETVDA